ncbi:MAG: acetyl-CoA hydrolase/transferase family protein [Verrucomicrobiales bacterium]|jgi:acetyl-CoA hydrolase|nr:acetyl-CoA hydrolase/transferase family protein [Verrucomicrobiales bacterium]
MSHGYKKLTAEQAAELIQNGETIGFSGFTPAGAAKAVPSAIAAKASKEHAAGRPFKVGVVTGASTGPMLDGALAKAEAVAWRTPYQSNADLRKGINNGSIRFFDMHLSMTPQAVNYGFLGKFQWAIVEAADITDNGEIVPSTSVGASPTFCHVADKIIVELNSAHPKTLRGFHDIYEPANPPHRQPIPIVKPSDRVGTPYIKVDPKKIVGVVETNLADETKGFDAPDPVTDQIGQNVADFLAAEMKAGRIPKEFLPIQSGVGNIANAVLGSLGKHPDIPPFEMFTEVVQDAVIDLMRSGKVKFATGTSLTVSGEKLKEVYSDLEFFRPRLLLRPQEITNHPEMVRRLGIITVNTAIEADLFGNINSTHVMGKNLMNGIGGSGDFTRNGYISIFTCPSVAKGGKISTIVPLVSHADHSEHSVQVLITEQGIADLRCKTPEERAVLIIEKCAHPDYRPQLLAYLERYRREGHVPQSLSAAFAMHEQFESTSDMRGVEWDKFGD